jgi:alpha-tubulin suppressor-like RCC1 family protein
VSGQSSLFGGKFSSISAGGAHSCAVQVSGDAVCWGSNSAGQSNVPDNFG